ncbi:MAG: hypothetical protein PUB13_09765 [Lachnospiraceae bacterium]|nr:hypothetical protein [Lachnospiraceae bacterium]
MMTDEKKERLQKIMNKITTANKFRLAFMYIAVVILVFWYFGEKLFKGVPWFVSFQSIALYITGWDVIFMVIATFLKLFFTVQYNKAVKEG